MHPGGGGESLEGIASWVAATGEPLLLPDPRRTGEVPPRAGRQAARDVLALPVAPEGRLACVLVVLAELGGGALRERGLALASAVNFPFGTERKKLIFNSTVVNVSPSPRVAA